MKNVIFSMVVIISAVCSFNSCKDDDNPPDYLKFVGDWHITDSCSYPYITNYDMKILGDTTGQSDDIITLKWLYGLDSTSQGYRFAVTATVKGDSFFISPQQDQGYTISGSGVSKTISYINFKWNGGPGGNCSSTGVLF
ncbi:MAG TPA: hypothetical protein VNJ29_02135 [Candidatus Nitrosotenuis sp.]|nr:hypothetical protein [Candidatus Nitrosotenuis sp.]